VKFWHFIENVTKIWRYKNFRNR